MRKIKLLTGLATISSLGMVVMPLTSCSKNSKNVKVTNITLDGKAYVLTNRSYSYNAKVLPEDATNKNVEWSIKYPEGSAAEAEVTADGRLKFTKHGEINLIATAKDGSGVQGTTTVWGLDESEAAEVSKYYFCNDDWSEICDYANQGYDALLDHYAGLKTLQHPFLGLERTIEINGQKHIVKVIGENHDTIADTNSKAALTFELFTVLSNKSRAPIKSKWDSEHHDKYLTSILRKNLNGADDSATWDDSTEKRTALQMLPEEVRKSVKTVKKEVATGLSLETMSQYQDKLFLLTCTELAVTPLPYAKTEGTPYQYWVDNQAKPTEDERNKGRIKRNIYGEAQFCLTGSPSSAYSSGHEHKHCFDINNNGSLSEYGIVDVAENIAFAFCI